MLGQRRGLLGGGDGSSITRDNKTTSLITGLHQFTSVTKRTILALILSLALIFVFEIITLYYTLAHNIPFFVYILLPTVLYVKLCFLTAQMFFERLRLRRRGYLNFYTDLTKLVHAPLAVYSLTLVLIFMFVQFTEEPDRLEKLTPDVFRLIQTIVWLVSNLIVGILLSLTLRQFLLHNKARKKPDMSDMINGQTRSSIRYGQIYSIGASDHPKAWKNPNVIIDSQSGSIMYLQNELQRRKKELESAYEIISQGSAAAVRVQLNKQIEEIRSLNIKNEELLIENEQLERLDQQLNLKLQDMVRQYNDIEKRNRMLRKENRDYQQLQKELEKTKLLLNVARDYEEKFQHFFDQFNISEFQIAIKNENGFIGLPEDFSSSSQDNNVGAGLIGSFEQPDRASSSIYAVAKNQENLL